MVRPAAEIRDLGTGSGTRGPKTRGEILLVARTRCQDPCGQELTDLQLLQGFRVRQRPFEKIYFVEQSHQLLCDSMEHHFSEPKRASIGQQPAGRRSCSAPLPGGRRIEVHPDFTARPQLGFVLPLATSSSRVASSDADSACRSSSPDSGKTRCVARRYSQTPHLDAELRRGCVAWVLTTFFSRSSSHFNTDTAPRTGVLVKRLQRLSRIWLAFTTDTSANRRCDHSRHGD